MATVTTTKRPLSPTLRWTTSDGRLTSEGFRQMREVSELVDTITIEDGEVTTDKIAVGAVEAQHITASKIDADEILQDGTLITDLIAANAVTNAATTYVELDDRYGDSLPDDVESTYLTLAFTPVSGRVLVEASFLIALLNTSTSPFTFRLKRAGSTVRSFSTSVTGQSSGGVAAYVNLKYVDESPGTSSISWTVTGHQTSGSISYDIINAIIVAQNLKK